jgi:hypothetical protein
MDKRQDNRSREMSDDDLLQEVAAAAAENPEVEAGEVLEALGVDDLATQRRVRRAFEANRDELVDQVRAQPSQPMPLAQMMLPWVRLNLTAASVAVRFQSAMLEAWSRSPPVAMVLQQDAPSPRGWSEMPGRTLQGRQ